MLISSPLHAPLLFAFSFVLSWLLLAQLREGLSGWVQGCSSKLRGQSNMFWLFYSHINSGIDHVCVKRKEKGAQESQKNHNQNSLESTASVTIQEM